MFNNIKILVIGDIMLDHYIYGKVNRISPEAPVPVVEVQDEINMLGGCGNVINNLYNLGISVYLFSALGPDKYGQEILKKLNDMKIDTNSIYSSKKILTNYKMRIVANNQHVVRADWDNYELDEEIIEYFSVNIPNIIDNVDGIIVSDYSKGVCSRQLVQQVISLGTDRNKPVFIDPKGKDWIKYSGGTFITPNAKEVSLILNKEIKTDDDFINSGIDIIEKYNIKNCLITRGSEGMIFINKNKSFYIQSEAHEVFDVSGAGDTVISCLAASILQGKAIKESVEFANKAAGIVVGHIGTFAITLEELDL